MKNLLVRFWPCIKKIWEYDLFFSIFCHVASNESSLKDPTYYPFLKTISHFNSLSHLIFIHLLAQFYSPQSLAKFRSSGHKNGGSNCKAQNQHDCCPLCTHWWCICNSRTPHGKFSTFLCQPSVWFLGKSNKKTAGTNSTNWLFMIWVDGHIFVSCTVVRI